MGLAYAWSTGTFITCDSEVEEMGLFDGANVWLGGSALAPEATLDVSSVTREPADVAVANQGRTMFLVDDDQDEIFAVSSGPDRTWGTADDRLRSFSTRPFQSRDPEGLGYGEGSLFVTDGDDTAVYRLSPGANGSFDGVAPGGDDVVTSFDTAVLGLADPEDVAYDPGSGHLFLVSRTDEVIVETTTAGVLVDRIDISSSGIRFPAGITVAPASQDPDETHVYVADRGIDNDAGPGSDPNENDGRIFEFDLVAAPDTVAPAAPTGLTSRRTSTGLALDWDDGAEPDLAGYEVSRAEGSGWTKLHGSLVAASAFTDLGALPDVTSSYRVVAVDASGNRSTPAEISAQRARIAFVGAASATTPSSSSLRIPRPVGLAPGDVLVAVVDVRGGDRAAAPAGWELLRSDALAGAIRQSVFVLVVPDGGRWSARWRLGSPSAVAGIIAAYRGVDAVDPVEVVGGRTRWDSDRILTPSVRPSTTGTLLVAFFGIKSGARIHPPAGMLEQAEARITQRSRRLATGVADEVLDTLSPSGRRIAVAEAAAANVGQVLLLRPAA
jgi:hypothetical protein